MLDLAVRDELRKIIDERGQEAVSSVRLIRGLLSDRRPASRTERNMLVTAVEANVPAEMVATTSVPWPLLRARMTDRLCDEHGMEKGNAEWVIDAWGYALRLSVTPASVTDGHNVVLDPLSQTWEMARQGGDKTIRARHKLATRPLHFIWVVDCSGSMRKHGKMQSLNNAVREAIPNLRYAAADNPNAQMFIRVITFSDGATWHVSQPTPIEDFTWQNIQPQGGVRDLGAAFKLLAEQLTVANMDERALPPVIVLFMDGEPTDDYQGHLRALLNESWGKRSVRIGIAIGADANEDVLLEFTGNPELVMDARNISYLAKRAIRWSS